MSKASRIQSIIAILGLALFALITYRRGESEANAVDKSDVPTSFRADLRPPGANAVEFVPSASADEMTCNESDAEVAGIEASQVAEELSEPDIIAALQTLTIAESLGQIENLVQQLAAKNYGAALMFAREQPAGFVRERLIERIAFVQAQESPERAARLVMEEIAPGQRQSEAAMMVLHQWALKDPAAAAGWIELFLQGALKERAERELHGIKSAAR